MEENLCLRQQVSASIFTFAAYSSCCRLLLLFPHLLGHRCLMVQLMEMSRGDKQIVVDIEPTSYEDGQSSESVTNGCNSTGPQEHDDSSDTSLKLG